MSNSYYNHGSYPTTGAPGTSASLRSELDSITSGFNLLPTISGNGSKAVVVNSGATALTVTTGTLALAGNFATTGAYNTTLIQGATTSLTLPLVSGTLATLAGTEEFTNKTLTSAVAKGTWTTSGTWTLPALTLGGAITYGGVTLSNAVTGTGNMVLSASPTLTGTIAAASQTLSGTLGVTGVATFTAQPIMSSLTASKPVFTDASKGLTSTGTLAYDQGGTGLTSYTAGDIIYASGANTVAKLPIGTTGQRLVVAAGLPSWATDTTIGTVTSVGWTGGIVSVATATTTPAFTIAGTSGGIPYFSSATTWATSAALTASALMIGGGAGAAPATTTTGTGVVTALGINTGSAGAMVLFNGALGTPTSGTATNLTGLPLTTGVTGTLPVANGGTGLTAGTSGGVLAYTATGTLASSTLLAANALMIGGGAGVAPSTTTTGTGVVTALGVNTGTAGAFVVNGGALGSPSSAGTIPAFTLGGTVAGGGNQLNNVIIGTTTPLAGAFTTLSATTLSATGLAQFGVAAGTGQLNVQNATAGRTVANIQGVAAQAFIDNVGSGNTYLDQAHLYVRTYAAAQIADFSSTGLAVTGTLSASGTTTIGSGSTTAQGWVLGYFGLSGQSGIWKTGITPDQTNYSFRVTADPALLLNDATAIYTRIANSTITAHSSTGLAVTGTLSATGKITGAANFWSEGAGSDTAAVGNLFMLSNGAGGGSARYWATQQSASGAAKVDYYFNGTSWAQISSVSSTGLAVTGTLSASGLTTLGSVSSGIALAVTSSAPTYTGSFINSSATSAGLLIKAGSTSGHEVLDVQTYNATSLFKVVASGATTVTGTLSATGAISATGGSASSVVDPAMTINYQRVLRFNDSSNTSWAGYIISNGTALGVGGNTAVSIDVGGATYATVTSTGLAVTGTAIASTSVGVGNTTPSGGGAGIAFPATQSASSNANTLDDYEEGTWTPTIIGSSTNPTITYSVQAGQYTKIGRVCYIMCDVSMSSYSGGNGRVLVTGLPFTAASNTIGNGAMANTLVSYMDLPAGYSYITNYVDPSTTNFNWLAAGDNVGYSDMTVGQFQSATTFIVSGFYIVA